MNTAPDKNLTLYIAGPMTGLPNYNYPAFNALEAKLTGDRYVVLNPAFIDGGKIDPNMPAAYYLRKALTFLLQADAVVCLPGWTKSRGATLEVRIAWELDMPVYDTDWRRIPKPERLYGAAHSQDLPPVQAEPAADDGCEAGWRYLTEGETIREGDEVNMSSAGDPEDWQTMLGCFGRPVGKILARSKSLRRRIAAADASQPPTTTESILAEADRLVHGDRQSDYGHPLQDFTRTGRMWGAILGTDDVPAEKVGLCMVALKISRECNKPKRDNLVDGAGYLKCVDMCLEKRAQQDES